MHRTLPRLLVFVALLTLAASCGGGGKPYDASGGPEITSIEPASGGMAGGTAITIRGTSLSNPQPGEYQILIGGQPASKVEVLGSTEVRCETPAGAQGAADVTIVTVAGEGTLPAGFMYYPPPTVSSVDPTEGTRDGGVSVTVTGTGFLANDPGETVCLIGLKELGDLEVLSDTELTGLTPTSWTEVPKDVIVANRNGTGTLRNGFTYVGPIPQIYSVTPDFGQPLGGLPVTIVGDYFTEAGGELSVRFGSAEASLVTRIDDQTLTCITPVSTVVGFVDVTVGNNNGESSLEDGFYYLPPPVADSISPASGPIDGGTSVTISGDGFALGGAVVVRFAGAYATSVAVVDNNTITCVTPAGTSLGTVNVTVLNENGTDTIENGFEYLAPAFWWEDTLGSQLSPTGDSTASSVSLPFGFPFFGQAWSSVYAITDGHLDFGSSAYSSFTVANNLLPIPHISHFGSDCYTSTSNGIYATSHVSGRTIITYNGVPQCYNYGSNLVQIHLHQSGIFCILYKSSTFHNPSSYSSFTRVAINPGAGHTPVSVDFSSGTVTGGANDALYESFSSSSDLSGKRLVAVPNAAGGYDVTCITGIPTDPNP